MCCLPNSALVHLDLCAYGVISLSASSLHVEPEARGDRIQKFYLNFRAYVATVNSKRDGARACRGARGAVGACGVGRSRSVC
jgi:hypothetical protein